MGSASLCLGTLCTVAGEATCHRRSPKIGRPATPGRADGRFPSQVSEKTRTCDAKAIDLQRICHPPATEQPSNCDISLLGTAVNVPKSGKSTAKKVDFGVNLSKSGTFTAVRAEVTTANPAILRRRVFWWIGGKDFFSLPPIPKMCHTSVPDGLAVSKGGEGQRRLFWARWVIDLGQVGY